MAPKPDIELAVRDYHPLPGVNGFTATLTFDGRLAARVANYGRGENVYEFASPEDEALLSEYAAAWGRENDHTWEPEQALVGMLCQALELQLLSRALAQEAGAEAAVLVEKEPAKFLGATVYRKAYVVPVMPGQDAADVARSERAARYRLITP